MIYVENPKCPHCCKEIEIDDTYDIDYDDEDITLYQIGHCPECNREYQWQQSVVCVQWAVTDLRLV